MKIRNCCRANWIIFICCFCRFTCPAIFADDKNEKEDNDDAWVVDVEPGIKRYGKESKFSEIGQTNGFDVAPDGETIAFAAGGSIKFWDIESNKVSAKIDNANANKASYSSDGLRLYVAHYGGTENVVTIYNAITHDVERKLSLQPGDNDVEFSSTYNVIETDEDGNSTVVTKKSMHFNTQAIAISPNDDRVVVSDGNSFVLFDAQSGKQLARKKVSNYVRKLVFIEDGDKFVDTNGNIYSSDNGESEGRLPKAVFPQWMQSLEANPKNSSQLLTSDWNKGIVLYDLEEKERQELEMDSKVRQFMAATFSGNGKLIAGATYPVNQMGLKSKAAIFVWDAESGELQNQFEPSSGQIGTLKFSATGDKLFSKGYNEFGLTEWDLSQKKAKADGKGHKGPVYHMQFDRKGDSILTASYESGAIFFDLESGEPGRRIATQNPAHLDVDDEGRFFAVAASYNSLEIFDRKTNRSKSVNVRSVRRPSVISQFSSLLTGNNKRRQWENYAINNLCVADDNEHLLIACRGQYSCRFDKYDLTTGKSVERNKIDYDDLFETKKRDDNQVQYSQWQWQPRSLVISDNGELMAIINDQSEVIIFDAVDGQVVHELGKVAGQYNSRLYFLNEGSQLLVSANGKIAIWDTESGEKKSDDVKIGQHTAIGQMALSGDQRKLGLITNDGGPRIKVYDLDSMEEAFSKKTSGSYTSIALNKDGGKLAVAKSNCQFEVWDLEQLEK